MKDKEIFLTLNKMAVPVLLSSLGEMIFGIADSAIIGRTSVEGFAAVGIVSNLIYILTGTFGALSIAFVILFGKAVGNNNKEKQSIIFSNTFSFAFLIGISFAILAILFGKLFLKEIYGLNGFVLECAYEYLVIACWGLGLNLFIFLFSAYFKNLKKTIISLGINIISLILNLVIDYVLVFGKFGLPKLGVKGAAIGTVVGLTFNVFLFIVFFKRNQTIDVKFLISGKEMKELIKLYIPILGQDFIESTLFVMIIASIVTRLDTYSIAAYNLLELVLSFVILPAHAYGGVVMTLISQNYKGIITKKIEKYLQISVVCSGILVLIVGGTIAMFPNLLGIITNDAKLINEVENICISAIMIQFINVIYQICKYSMQSMEYESWVFKYTTIISLFSSIMIYILVTICKMDLMGVYLGIGIMYLISSIGYICKLNSHRNETIEEKYV